jgi:hypothetical protein
LTRRSRAFLVSQNAAERERHLLVVSMIADDRRLGGCGMFQIRRGTPGDVDLRAAVDQLVGDALADAAAGPGDDGDLSRQ